MADDDTRDKIDPTCPIPPTSKRCWRVSTLRRYGWRTDYLSQAGIESFVFDTASSRMLGTTAAVPARLMVHADAAADAANAEGSGLRKLA